MARYTGPVCRMCRRDGVKLFLKGPKCFSDKCPVEKRNFPPGQHGQSKKVKKLIGYGLQLREKQKAKRIYFTLETQFRAYYEKASTRHGVTGELLLQQLETRLDNVVYRLGFAISRRQARQVVRHGHVTVNGKRVTIPSYSVKPGDKVELKEKSRQLAIVLEANQLAERDIPDYLDVDHSKQSATYVRVPALADVPYPVQMEPNLVVEFYSR